MCRTYHCLYFKFRDKSHVKVFKNYKNGKLKTSDENHHRNYKGGNESESSAIIKHYLKLLFMLPFAFIKSLTLRHSKVVDSFMVAAIFFIIFVVIDIVSSHR